MTLFKVDQKQKSLQNPATQSIKKFFVEVTLRSFYPYMSGNKVGCAKLEQERKLGACG